MSRDFPGVDRNHLISNASKELFYALRPAAWNWTELDGDNDFGLDLFIQVAVAGQMRHSFHAQLKGTEAPSISSDGKTLSVKLKRSTLNYLANMTGPVMLLVAVVQLDDENKPLRSASRILWHWLDSGIDNSSQETVTVHVSTDNELTPSLDVIARLQDRTDELRALASLGDLVRSAPGSERAVNPIQRILDTAAKNPSAFASLLSPRDHEDARLAPALQEMFAEANAYLRAGRTTLAEQTVKRIDVSGGELDSVARAMRYSVLGRIAVQRGRRVEALDHFETAYGLDPIEKYLVAREELLLLRAIESDKGGALTARVKALERVESDDGLTLLARAFIASGDYESATAVAARASNARQLYIQALILSASEQWSKAIALVTETLAQDSVSPNEAILLHLVAALAAWSQALSNIALANDAIVPLSGPVGIDVEAARTAFIHAEKCLLLLKEIGWPPNVEVIASVAAASSSVIGAQRRVFDLLRDASSDRPEYVVVQHALELLAISLEERAVALAANGYQHRDTPSLSRRVCLLFQERRLAECVAEANGLLGAGGLASEETPLAYAMAYAAATRLARVDEAKRFLSKLQEHAPWDEYVYFARFIEATTLRQSDINPLNVLRNGIARHPQSRLLCGNLFVNLDVSEEANAIEAVEVAESLRSSALLSAPEATKVITALFRLGRWQSGEAEARDAISRFGESEELLSLLAVALEMQGSTSEALALLERSIAFGSGRRTTLRNYLGVCLRLGRVVTARQTIEALLSTNIPRKERLELLRLDALMLAQMGEDVRAREVAGVLSELVDRSNELEEGMYLSVFLAITLNYTSASEEERRAFNERVDKFTKAWPTSALLRQVSLPTQRKMTVDDLYDLLDPVVGDARKRMREYQEREQQAKSGELPFPFIIRPGFVLHYIGDPFSLWRASKSSRREDRQLHLTCCVIEEARSNRLVLRDTPLLDLTALLLLHDLELFDILFHLYRRIALPKRTIEYISQQARGLLVPPAAAEIASSLLAKINANLERIEQVAGDSIANKATDIKEVFDDYVALARTGKWAVYSDDAFARAWVAAEGRAHHAVSTVDLLTIADDLSAIAPAAVADILARLISWNVGVVVSNRHLLAGLKGALSDTNERISTAAKLGRFQEHEPFATLARAIWQLDKSPEELVLSCGNLVADMLADRASDEESVAAIWSFWFLRVIFSPALNGLEWEMLCYSLVLALLRLPDDAAPRALRAFLLVVEVKLTSDRTTSSALRRILGRLGEVAGRLASSNAKAGHSIREKVSHAIPRGTADGDAFEGAFVEALAVALPR